MIAAAWRLALVAILTAAPIGASGLADRCLALACVAACGVVGALYGLDFLLRVIGWMWL